jgi:hypothetical protein
MREICVSSTRIIFKNGDKLLYHELTGCPGLDIAFCPSSNCWVLKCGVDIETDGCPRVNQEGEVNKSCLTDPYVSILKRGDPVP